MTWCSSISLPEVGKQVSAGEDCAVAESVKAASDIYSPVSGGSSRQRRLEGSPSWSAPTPMAPAGCFRIQAGRTRASSPTCWMPTATRTWWTKK